VSDDLPDVGNALQIAVALGGLITSVEISADTMEQLIDGYEAMAVMFADNGLGEAATAIRAGNDALTSHAQMLRSVAATLEPVVTIFHKADQGAQ
jgi:hypothetical protein